MVLYGLIGYPLGHSFSEKYFREKFSREHISGVDYRLFPLPQISLLAELLADYPALTGLNVTIPYKTAVLPFVQALSAEARDIGAVNTISIRDGKLAGYNTDAYGFEQSLLPLLNPALQKALVLGTGGAAKAVMYVLKKLGMDATTVSRTDKGDMTYAELAKTGWQDYRLIINTTPLGSWPDVNHCPPLPYDAITPEFLLYDLAYNPGETLFLQKGRQQGAAIKNGLEMLHLQAEKSWEIWNRI